MTKRMTRTMADHAATMLAKIAYDEKIDKATKARKDFGDFLINKYVPKPVLDCAKEYDNCFDHYDAFFATANIKDSGWGNRKEIPTNLVNPVRRYITIEKSEFSHAGDLVAKEVELVRLKNEYITNVSDALVTLKTEARIKESFPEALPYLNFAETNLPAANYSKLRQLLK